MVSGSKGQNPPPNTFIFTLGPQNRRAGLLQAWDADGVRGSFQQLSKSRWLQNSNLLQHSRQLPPISTENTRFSHLQSFSFVSV